MRRAKKYGIEVSEAVKKKAEMHVMGEMIFEMDDKYNYNVEDGIMYRTLKEEGGMQIMPEIVNSDGSTKVAALDADTPVATEITMSDMKKMMEELMDKVNQFASSKVENKSEVTNMSDIETLTKELAAIRGELEAMKPKLPPVAADTKSMPVTASEEDIKSLATDSKFVAETIVKTDKEMVKMQEQIKSLSMELEKIHNQAAPRGTVDASGRDGEDTITEITLAELDKDMDTIFDMHENGLASGFLKIRSSEMTA